MPLEYLIGKTVQMVEDVGESVVLHFTDGSKLEFMDFFYDNPQETTGAGFVSFDLTQENQT